MHEDRVTNAELYRLLVSMKEQLEDVYREQKKTNGNVIRHEERLNGLDREVRDIKVSRGMKTGASSGGVTITVPTDGKTIATLLLALGALLTALVTALAKGTGG